MENRVIKNAKIWISLASLVIALAGLVIAIGDWLFPVNSSSNINSVSNVVYGSNNVVNSSIVTTSVVNNVGNSYMNASVPSSRVTQSSVFEPTTEQLFDKTNILAPTLTVSGMDTEVKILVGPDDTVFTGGIIDSMDAKSIIYVKQKQHINLIISGMDATVWVQSALMPYINVSNTAMGAAVREL